MDSNSLPMAPDLEVFPRFVQLAILGILFFFVSVLVLAIVVGILST